MYVTISSMDSHVRLSSSIYFYGNMDISGVNKENDLIFS